MKKISLLFAMMLVMLTTVSAKAQDLYNELNGTWNAQAEMQDGNMTSTMKWSLSFDSSNGQVAMALSIDTNGINDFFIFESGGTYTVDGDTLKMDWDLPGSKLTFNQFAEIMFGDQASQIKGGMEQELRGQLKEMDEAKIQDLNGNSFKYIDKDGTVLDFVKAN